MLPKVSNEMREMAGLASVAGRLAVARVSLAIAAALVLEHPS